MPFISYLFQLFGRLLTKLNSSVCCLTLVLGTVLCAETYNVRMMKDAPVSIKIETPFSQGPAGGHTEFVVHINNRMQQAGTWRLSLENSNRRHRNRTTYRTSAEFKVPAEQKQTFKLTVPVLEQYINGYVSSNLSGEFVGDYTERSNLSIQLINHRSRFEGIVLLSPELYRAHGSSLEDYYGKKSSGYTVSRYYEDLMSDDWRVYVGFERILVTRADWLGLKVGVRKAILDAVAAGHVDLRFHLPKITAEIAAELDIPIGDKVWRHGLGVVSRYSGSKDYLASLLDKRGDLSSTIFTKASPRVSDDDRIGLPKMPSKKRSAQDLPIESRVSDKVPPAGMLSLIMLGFGVLIGPINFFVFSRGRRSLRLFVTTPLIAGAASLVLLLGIVLFDGVGGSGYISRLIYLSDDERQVYVEQEVVSDTGLYFSKPFEVAGADWIHSRGSSITDLSKVNTAGTFSRNGEIHSGDWFASKRLQVMGIKTYIPSREAIELLPQSDASAPPKVVSNFRGICDVFYYVDAELNVWKANELKLGGEQSLVRVEKDELFDWWRIETIRSGKDLERKLMEIGIRPEHFYSTVSSWQQDDLETVSNIQWEIHSQLLIGALRQPSQKGGAR
ncbi:MAG: hypothetical protein ACSHYA_19445 [Opitutaceae bacterium]